MNRLVAYGSDSDEENEKVEAVGATTSHVSSPKEDGNSEPRPPKRPDEDERSDCSLTEEFVDAAVRDGMDLLKADELMDMAPATPQSNVDSGGDGTPKQTPSAYTTEPPPSPPGECDPYLRAKFEGYFEKKARGVRMNDSIKKHKNFKNPALYEFLVVNYQIDEKGTNFPEHIFNPRRFKKEDYYEHFRELDHKKGLEMEKIRKEQERVVAEATAAAAVAAKKQKSRFADAK